MRTMLILLLIQASLAWGQSTGYFRYHLMATTGLADQIKLPNDQRISIQFSKQSNPVALIALRTIPYEGINGIFEDDRLVAGQPFQQRITLEGTLLPEVKHTRKRVNGPEPENYQEFILKNWRIAIPFNVAVPLNRDDPLGSVKVITHTSLRSALREDLYIGGKKVHTRRFEQTESNR